MEYQLIQLLKRDAHTVIGMLDELEAHLEGVKHEWLMAAGNSTVHTYVLEHRVEELHLIRLGLMQQFKVREGTDL